MTATRDNTALFRKGLEILCAGFSRELTKPLMDAYYLTLGSVLTDDQWREGVRRALAEEERMPVPAWFLRDQRAEVDRAVTSEAVMIFGQIADGRCTVGVGGTRYVSARSVERRLGQEAAEAFTVAGGEAAFLNIRPQDLPFVQQRFIAAYKGAVLSAAARRRGELSDGSSGRGRPALAPAGGSAAPEPEGSRGRAGSRLEPA